MLYLNMNPEIIDPCTWWLGAWPVQKEGLKFRLNLRTGINVSVFTILSLLFYDLKD